MNSDDSSDRAALGTDSPPGRASDDARIPLVEERATVTKRAVERVGARIALRTHEEDVPYAERLRQERVRIERVPLDTIVDEAPVSREEDGVLVVPVIEEVLVKRFRVIEEVRITSHAEEVEVRDTVTLRRQEAIVDEDGTAAGKGASPPPPR